MITTIIFDFFGVIRTDAYKSWLQIHHHKMEGDFLAASQQMDRGEIDTATFLAQLGTITGKAPDAIFAEMEATAGLDQEVLAIVQALAGRYKLGLLSNSSAAFLRGILKQYDLEKYFDAVVISSDVGLIKPDPAIFTVTLHQLNSAPQETIFIDDSPRNVGSATALGIRSILYTDVATLKADLHTLGIT